MRLSSPLVFDSYRRNRVTGSLIVIDEATNETVAAGVILDTEVEEIADLEPKTERSPNVRWQGSRMTRERRWSSLGHAGATLWFTGLPGAGKSTVAAAVEERLIQAGQPAFLLDGDNLRHGLNGDLGFDEHARTRERASHRACGEPAGRVGDDRARQPRQPLRCGSRGGRRRCTRQTTWDSSRSSSTPRWSSASSATPRVSMRGRARVSSRASPEWGRPTRRPPTPDLVLGSHEETVEQEVERVMDLLAARGLIAKPS